MKKVVRNKIEFALFRVIRWLLMLFPYRISLKLMESLFRWGGYYLGIRREVGVKNLKKVFPEMSRRNIRNTLMEMYRQLGITAAETYLADQEKLYSQIRLKDWQNLETAFSKNKGVLLASLHMGNWELGGRYIGRHHPLGVIYKKLRNGLFDDYTNQDREKCGIVMIPKKKALKMIMKLLDQKYVVTIMIDQNAGKMGVLTNFLGHPASTFQGIARIAIKTGSPIVPGVAYRDEDDKNVLSFEEMILPDQYDNSPESVKELTERVSHCLEKYILKYPAQWFWVHRRWRGAKHLIPAEGEKND